VGPGDLRELHKTMQKKCSGLLPTKVHIAPASRHRWEQTPAHETCDFQMVPNNRAHGETVFRGRKRHRVPVLLLHPLDPGSGSWYWISWYEQWRRDDKSGFVLLTASWTVYRGIPAQPDKAQLVRADWDQLGTNTGSKDAGQPHWHFDQPVAVSAVVPPAGSTLTLREVQPPHVGAPLSILSPKREMSVDHVHLAMGAWDANIPHPKCWQREAQTWPDIATWATRTL